MNQSYKKDTREHEELTKMVTSPFSSNLLDNRLEPILKWAGGKEQELKYIHKYMPQHFKSYFEPFVGGGAAYFSLKADKMFINDRSTELVDLYKAVQLQDEIFFQVVEDFILHWNSIETIVLASKEDIQNIYRSFSNDEIDSLYLSNWIKSFIDKYSDKFMEMFNKFFAASSSNFIKELNNSLNEKLKRMKKIETEKGKLPDKDILDNFESAIKSAFYTQVRYLYNNIEKYNINSSFATAIFFFIRNYAYSGMFRYNQDGGFNVPYGGIGYNRKNLSRKVDYLKSKEIVEHLKDTTIDSLDFQEFFEKHKPQKDDFIFLDPPYDSEFSTYAKNEFTRADQQRLADYLINKCEANWMIIIKNTDFIYSLYDKPSLNMVSYDKKYLVSFQNRNDKNAEHLLIRNYFLSEETSL
jgi:DNA adenine methylase